SMLTGMGLTEFAWPEDAPTSAFSLFNAIGIIMMIVGIGFSKRLADKFGKRNVYGLSLFLSTVFIAAFYFYSPEAIGFIFLVQSQHGYFNGISITLLRSIIDGVADYSE